MAVKILIILSFLSAVIQAQNKIKFSDLGDFNLVSGKVISDCKIGYRTYGKLNDKKDNGILYLTWFGGRSEHLVNYIGENKQLDSTKYFIITVDALGNGVSSSPSNSIEQADSLFPEFTIKDMVNSQFNLLKNEFGIEQLYAVYGGSMGAMQVFEWVVSYPGFIKKAVAYVGTPKLTSYDFLLWQTELNAIETGHKYAAEDEDIIKTVAAVQTLLIRTPEYMVEKIPPGDLNLNEIYKSYKNIFDSYDWASQLRAMINHDVSSSFSSMEEAAENVKTEMLIIVGSKDHIVRPEPAIEFAELTNSRLLVLDNNCGHLAPGCESELFLNKIRGFLYK